MTQMTTHMQSMKEKLAALDRMTTGQLQSCWQDAFNEPCRSRNKAYMLKRLRYRIQEQALGGLSERARERILALAETSTFRQRPPRQALPFRRPEAEARNLQQLVQLREESAEASVEQQQEAPQPHIQDRPRSIAAIHEGARPQQAEAVNQEINATQPAQPTQPAHPLDARLPTPGSMLRRVYRGRVCEVKVLENGFLYEGNHYKSLSKIARCITGTAWNGFAFFKLEPPSDHPRDSSNQGD